MQKEEDVSVPATPSGLSTPVMYNSLSTVGSAYPQLTSLHGGGRAVKVVYKGDVRRFHLTGDQISFADFKNHILGLYNLGKKDVVMEYYDGAQVMFNVTLANDQDLREAFNVVPGLLLLEVFPAGGKHKKHSKSKHHHHHHDSDSSSDSSSSSSSSDSEEEKRKKKKKKNKNKKKSKKDKRKKKHKKDYSSTESSSGSESEDDSRESKRHERRRQKELKKEQKRLKKEEKKAEKARKKAEEEEKKIEKKEAAPASEVQQSEQQPITTPQP
eukprot:TRINITY_DN4351_c0_g1_i2.p1 TRINITY_DN4351_c0_g1~~TRINITY_DN4351_c0_g1_i2.p1  ORF type:complete len:270 (+),score=108.47 TRINITY_DN4351_c0_g1_i2:51-860(+)